MPSMACQNVMGTLLLADSVGQLGRLQLRAECGDVSGLLRYFRVGSIQVVFIHGVMQYKCLLGIVGLVQGLLDRGAGRSLGSVLPFVHYAPGDTGGRGDDDKTE